MHVKNWKRLRYVVYQLGIFLMCAEYARYTFDMLDMLRDESNQRLKFCFQSLKTLYLASKNPLLVNLKPPIKIEWSSFFLSSPVYFLLLQSLIWFGFVNLLRPWRLANNEQWPRSESLGLLAHLCLIYV